MTPLDTVALAVSAVTALVGLFVTYQAYRGYRRNDSETMRALAVGIAFIAVVPFVILRMLGTVADFTDAQGLVIAFGSHVIGLLAIYRSFD